MNPIRESRSGSWTVGGEQAGQPEYLPLEIVRDEQGALWSAWRANWRERLLILLGYPVRIGILAQRQPPIIVTAALDALREKTDG